MADAAFPGFGNSASDPSVPAAANPASSSLPGLSFSVRKKPMFSTRVSTAVSAREVRNAMQDMPVWEFDWEYEFLEDKSGAESSLKMIMGFFLSMRGRATAFLIKDPDDYLAVSGTLGLGDGVTTQYYFRRDMGAFAEIVGQVDTDNDVSVSLDVAEAHTSATTVTVDHAATFLLDQGVTVNDVTFVKVAGPPGPGEYSVNIGTGQYSFHATDTSGDAVVSYRYGVDPADYTVTMPNKLVFDSAPPVGVVRASFQFFFVCRFREDDQEYEKFMNQLWSLQSCNFRSIIQ